ncbi:MAG: hypothetical protein AAGD05_17485, partial [Bacteroidota bacterium]
NTHIVFSRFTNTHTRWWGTSGFASIAKTHLPKNHAFKGASSPQFTVPMILTSSFMMNEYHCI